MGKLGGKVTFFSLPSFFHTREVEEVEEVEFKVSSVRKLELKT